MSANNIITLSYCLVKDGKAYEGTKEQIVLQICNFEFINRRLVVHFPYWCLPVRLHTYSKEWTEHEMNCDAIVIIFDRLINNYGYRMYRNISM
jgi:hypothetical protein